MHQPPKFIEAEPAAPPQLETPDTEPAAQVEKPKRVRKTVKKKTVPE
jgi:hypothetical protein